jgi:hypothetical protein
MRSEAMLEFLRTPTAQAVIAVAVLAALSMVGYYVVLRFRGRTGEDRQSASDWLSSYRELHQQGDISDAEYRTIKTVLGDKLQKELKEKEQQT